MDLIDTHQHLIYRAELGYGWTAGIAALAEGDFTLADYRALTAGLGIAGTLYMECAVDDPQWRDEARMVARLMEDPGSGLLGQIASCRPEDEAGLAEWLDAAPALGIRGFRRVLHVVSDEVSQAQAFRRGLREMQRRGFAFDMCVLARQLPLARDLAGACDGGPLVLDHCGVPDIAGGAFEPWAEGIAALARLPHVHVKLSGITAYAQPGATLADLRPWVDHVLSCFGADRMLWGSDWPVVNLGAGLPGWIAMTREILAGLSEAEQAAVARGTARRVYGLD